MQCSEYWLDTNETELKRQIHLLIKYSDIEKKITSNMDCKYNEMQVILAVMFNFFRKI